jgi:energy-coupling factor transporter transmembrane protein EcfT
MVSHRTNSCASLFISCCFLFMVSHRTNSYASLFIFCCFLFMVFLTEPTLMLLCLSLVVFVHGFSQDLTPMLLLFIFCCFCSWFFSRNQQLLCFFVYLLLCLSMVPHRTNSYASLFILYFVHGFSLLGTDHTDLCVAMHRYIHKKHCFSFLQQERTMSS